MLEKKTFNTTYFNFIITTFIKLSNPLLIRCFSASHILFYFYKKNMTFMWGKTHKKPNKEKPNKILKISVKALALSSSY